MDLEEFILVFLSVGIKDVSYGIWFEFFLNLKNFDEGLVKIFGELFYFLWNLFGY